MVYEIILIILMSIVPGYLIVSLLDKRLDDVEKLAVSFGVSFIIFGGLGLLFHIIGIPLVFTTFVIIPIGVAALLKRQKITFSISKWLLLILILAIVLRFGLQFLFTVPIVGDSYYHMDMARTFTTNDWFEVNAVFNLWSGVSFPFPEDYRPPFFNFIMGYFLNIFGSNTLDSIFMAGKLLNVFIGMILIVPTYLIAKKYGNEKIALIASLFLAISPPIIAQSMEAEVRIITVYLALVSFYFFVRGRSFWMYSGAFLGMLYITHYAPGVILALTYGVYYILCNRKEFFKKETLLLILIFLLVISPWLIRNYDTFGNPVYSSSREVSYFIEFNQIATLERVTLDDYIDYVKTSPDKFILAKVTNLIRLFFPVPFQAADENIFFNLDPINNRNLFANPVSIILTVPIFAFSVYYLYKSVKNFRKEKNMILIFVLVALVTSLLFWSYRSPVTYNFFFPQLFLMHVVGIIALEKMKNLQKYKKFLYIAIIISLVVQVPLWQSRFEPKSDFGQSWIRENTELDDIIMVSWTDIHAHNLLTDRKTITIPFEEEDRVLDFAREHNVDYLIVSQLDLDTKKLSVESLQNKVELVDVYNVPEPEGSRQYANKYWIFKI